MSSRNVCSLTNGTYILGFLLYQQLLSHYIFHFHISIKRFCLLILIEALVIVGGNLWRSKHSTKNTSHAPKASMHQRKNQIEYNLSRFQRQPIMNNQFKSVEGGFIYKENDKKYIPKAITKQSSDSQPGASKPKDIVGSIKHFFVTLFWFSYPYTMFGRVSLIFFYYHSNK